MGFGSYDENEQEKQRIDGDELEDDDAVQNEEADANGDVSYEFDGKSTEELVKKLEEIKA